MCKTVADRMSTNSGNIVVVGYPKSGNTWLTRLVAELLRAPAQGLWGFPDHPELAIEGLERDSGFAVYKAHQTADALWQVGTIRTALYVTRDVRDIAVSAAHYFELPPRRERFSRIVRALSRSARIRLALARSARRSKYATMIRVLSEGDAGLNEWLALPWDDHVSGYLERGISPIRYEDLLAEPIAVCERILDEIGVDRTHREIEAAVAKQSFADSKQRFVAVGDVRRARFLRQGKAGGWRDALGTAQAAELSVRFAKTLSALDYSLD